MNENDILFGQFLKKHSELRISDDNIAEAINIQREESMAGMKCRKFGIILLEEFSVFKDLNHLKEYLMKFNSLKESLGLDVDDIDDNYR